MAKILPFHLKPRLSPGLITMKPLEFRRADWESTHFLQMLKHQSEELERHRKEEFGKRESGIPDLPSHLVLKGGMACTIAGLYRHRENEEKMRDAYYLAGLVDCMVNQENPVLRTGLIHELYHKVLILRTELHVNWYGPIDQVLFPLDSRFFSEIDYRNEMANARELSALYRVVREGTDRMFDILSLQYCFYVPGAEV